MGEWDDFELDEGRGWIRIGGVGLRRKMRVKDDGRRDEKSINKGRGMDERDEGRGMDD